MILHTVNRRLIAPTSIETPKEGNTWDQRLWDWKQDDVH